MHGKNPSPPDKQPPPPSTPCPGGPVSIRFGAARPCPCGTGGRQVHRVRRVGMLGRSNTARPRGPSTRGAEARAVTHCRHDVARGTGTCSPLGGMQAFVAAVRGKSACISGTRGREAQGEPRTPTGAPRDSPHRAARGDRVGCRGMRPAPGASEESGAVRRARRGVSAHIVHSGGALQQQAWECGG